MPYPSPVFTVVSDGRGFSRLVPVPYRTSGLSGPGDGRSLAPSPTAHPSVETLEQTKSSQMLVNGSATSKRLRVKKPKRVMNAPFLQALQQPGGQFQLQAYELVRPEKLQHHHQGPADEQRKLQRQELSPVKPRPKAKPSRTNDESTNNPPVVVSSVGSTTADAPVGRVPVAPTVSEYYPFYGSPMTDQREEASLILEPSSKAISGNGGTAISTPVSHAILKQGSSTKILFRPQSVAIVGANGRAHAQADLIVDYVK